MGIFDDIDRAYRHNPPTSPQSKPCCAHCESTVGLEQCEVPVRDAAVNSPATALLCAPCAAHNVMLHAPRWFWAVGEDEDDCPDGYRFEWTREEAIAKARAEANPGDVIILCYSRPKPIIDDVFFGSVEEIIDNFQDENSDVTDFEPLNTTAQQDDELAIMLGETFRRWRLKNRLGRSLYPAVEDMEVVKVPGSPSTEE